MTFEEFEKWLNEKLFKDSLAPVAGCDVCHGVKILHGTFSGVVRINADTQMEVDSDGDVDFDFCPCCGRCLYESEKTYDTDHADEGGE